MAQRTRRQSAHLLAEEPVVVVAIQADVVEDAPSSIEVDFVSARPLHNAHTGRQRQQIFELALRPSTGACLIAI